MNTVEGMNKQSDVSTLFLDIGGVILTNGWDRHARKRAADHFDLHLIEFNERHHLTFDTYEEGKINLDEYLARVIFYKERSFSRDEFKKFMYDQSQPLQDALEYFHELKTHYGLKVVAVSNEGQELTEHRVEKFALRQLFDAFISSCFVHCRKPDADIYRMALNVIRRYI